jgi:hypothetical protein
VAVPFFSTQFAEINHSFPSRRNGARIGAFSRIMMVSLDHTNPSSVEALAQQPLVSMEEEGL